MNTISNSARSSLAWILMLSLRKKAAESTPAHSFHRCSGFMGTRASFPPERVEGPRAKRRPAHLHCIRFHLETYSNHATWATVFSDVAMRPAKVTSARTRNNFFFFFMIQCQGHAGMERGALTYSWTKVHETQDHRYRGPNPAEAPRSQTLT